MLKKTVYKCRKIGCFAPLGVGIFLFIVAMVITIEFNVTSGTFLDSLVVVLFPLSFLVLFGSLIVLWIVFIIGVEPMVRNTYKQISKAVRRRKYKRGFIRGGKHHIHI